MLENNHLSDQFSRIKRGQSVMLRLAEGLLVTQLCQIMEQCASGDKSEREAYSSSCLSGKSEILKVIRAKSRGASQLARARQRAMYLAHVAGGLSLTSVGAGFGRDRTTVRHACAFWEDARDKRDIDVALSYEEASLQAMLEMLGFAPETHSFSCIV